MSDYMKRREAQYAASKAKREAEEHGWIDRYPHLRAVDSEELHRRIEANEREKFERANPKSRKTPPSKKAKYGKKYNKSYYEKNIHHVKAYQHGRRAIALGCTGGSYTTGDHIKQRFQMWENACWVCKGEAEAIDHVKPMSKGGSNYPSNLRPICKSCNSSKGDTWPYYPYTHGLTRVTHG